MNYPRTSEGYAEYLKSEHWDLLRTAVLERDKACVRCGSRKRLQAHHKFYRADWEEAQPADCETLCRGCHANQHGKPVEQKPLAVKVELVQIQSDCPYANFRELAKARSRNWITRQEYLKWAPVLRAARPKHKRRSKPRKPKRWMPKKLRKPLNNGDSSFGCKPWYYNPRRPHWVNRGNSSN